MTRAATVLSYPAETMSEADRCGNSDRPLTHHSDCGGRGLAMQATPNNPHNLDLTECVLGGSINNSGYARVWDPVSKRLSLAHRYAWEQEHGPIPAGMTVDHLCFRTACVNVAHLRLLTPAQNAEHRRSKLSENCARGHLKTPESWRPDASGWFRCMVCAQERQRTYRAGKAVRGHRRTYVSPGVWRCPCGHPLGSSNAEAKEAMREHRAAIVRERQAT